MKSFTKFGLAAVLSAAMTFSAMALEITPASGVLASGPETSQPAIDAIIGPIMGSAIELYKQNAGGAEERALADSYETSFNETLSGGTITYTGGDIVSPPAFLLVKDGAAAPAWYLFGLTTLGWDGMEDLVLSGFWVGVQGEISHVTLYGTRGTSVPDGGATLALLGMAVGLMGFARRRFSA